MSNTAVSGKRQNLKRFERKREDALKAGQETDTAPATPATPPQDEPKATQTVEPESPPAKQDQAPPVETDTEQPKEKPILDVDYKQQYRTAMEDNRKLRAAQETLKGMHKKSEAENKQLKQRVEQLEQASPGNDLLDSARSTEHYKRIAAEYDEDTAEHILSLADHMVRQVRPASSQDTDDVDAVGDEDPFFVSMDRRLPGWDVNYNDNQKFEKWANTTTEPVSGKSYLSLLKEAHSANDTDTAVRIFSAFDSQVRKADVPSQDDLIEPSGSGGGGKTQPDAPTFKSGDLKEHGRLLRTGKISHKQYEEFKANYMKAVNEGRVTD